MSSSVPAQKAWRPPTPALSCEGGGEMGGSTVMPRAFVCCSAMLDSSRRDRHRQRATTLPVGGPARLLELEYASNDRQVSRRAPAALDHVREPREGSEARAEERALGEVRVEWQVVRIHRPLEERPAAVEQHVAEVSLRVAEVAAPVDDPGEPTRRLADDHVLHLQIAVNEPRRSQV